MAERNHTGILQRGNIIFTKAVEGLCYGSLYGHELTTTENMVQNIYMFLSGAVLFSGGLVNNVVASIVSGSLTIQKAGIYKVDWGMSCESATASQDIDVDLFINTVEQPDGAARRVLGAANDKGNMGGTALLDCSQGDEIRLAVKNNTSSNDIIIYDINMNVIQIGGT